MLSNALRGHLAELGIASAKWRNGTAELPKDYRLLGARLQGAEAVARGLRQADYEMATPIDERMTT